METIEPESEKKEDELLRDVIDNKFNIIDWPSLKSSISIGSNNGIVRFTLNNIPENNSSFFREKILEVSEEQGCAYSLVKKLVEKIESMYEDGRNNINDIKVIAEVLLVIKKDLKLFEDCEREQGRGGLLLNLLSKIKKIMPSLIDKDFVEGLDTYNFKDLTEDELIISTSISKKILSALK